MIWLSWLSIVGQGLLTYKLAIQGILLSFFFACRLGRVVGLGGPCVHQDKYSSHKLLYSTGGLRHHALEYRCSRRSPDAEI